MNKGMKLVLLLSLHTPCFSQANQCLDSFKDRKTITNEELGLLNESIVKANDIRGVFQKDFNLKLPETIGRVIMSLSEKKFSVKNPKILIAHDARTSSPQLVKILLDTLLKQGATVSVVGLLPTPVAYYLLHHYDYTATVIVTASHNPIGHNGFKTMFNNKYETFNIMPEIKRVIEERDFLKDDHFKSRRVTLDPYTPYINSLKKEFPNLKSIPFVVDAGNGSAGLLAKEVFRALDLKPYYLYTRPDGNFPNHHPDPSKEANLIDLKKKVTETGSLFGVGYDGDGDRLNVVTYNHKFIQSDEFSYMFLPSLLGESKSSNKTLISDVKTSNWFNEKVKEMGGRIIVSKTGYTLLRENMNKNKATFATEYSGHIMFNDRPNRGFDDAIYNTLRFIELIGDKKETIEKLLPKVNTVTTNEIRWELDQESIQKALKKLKDYLDKNQEEYLDIDGIRITRGKAWGLVRSSNSEPVISLRFEADSEKEIMDFIDEFSKAMGIEIPREKILFYN